MRTTKEKSDQSTRLVLNLLEQHFTGNNTISILQSNKLSDEKLLPRFNAKGSTRIEVLYDIVATGGNCEVINLQGLAENCEEEQVPIIFFCEMVWLDAGKTMMSVDAKEQLPSSFVIDPLENPSTFRNTVFSVLFENQQNGKLIGKGEGYLRFDKCQS